MMLLALALATAPVPSGPAILYIRGKALYFVPFSSFARCEAARRMIEQQWAAYNAEMERKGYRLVESSGNQAVCIPG